MIYILCLFYFACFQYSFFFLKKQNKQHLSFFDGLHVPLISISWSYTISWRRTGFQHILVIFLAHRYVIHQLITSFSSVRAEKLPNCLGVELSSPDHIINTEH